MAGTKHFSRMNYNVRRGMRELLSHRHLSDKEWIEIRDFFGNRCAFCGSEDSGNPRTGIVPDHLIATANHGEFCLGNVVPSCQYCNDHRGKKEWRQYMLSRFGNEAESRIGKIATYLSNYEYSVSDDPHEHLSNEETEEYLALLESWGSLWCRAQALRDRIIKRRRQGET